MKPTTFNNAIVSTVSAYAEVLQELVKENNLLKDQVRNLHQINAVPDGEMLVPKKYYEALRRALQRDERAQSAAEIQMAARELIFATENP